MSRFINCGDNPSSSWEGTQDLFNSILMGNFGDIELITQGAIYLGSDESVYTTGSELVIDGDILPYKLISGKGIVSFQLDSVAG